MKKLILILAMLMWVPAHAADSKKVEELDTEVEAEKLDVYEQQQMEEQARREALAFDQQAKLLEKQIASLKAESKNISSRLDRQGEKFKKISKLAAEAQRKANALQAQRNQLKAKSDSLQSRISQAQSRLTTAEEFQRSLSKEIQEKNSEQRDLNTRLKAADIRIARAQAAIKNLRVKNHRLSENNRRLEQRVAQRSHMADKLEERSLENDL